MPTHLSTKCFVFVKAPQEEARGLMAVTYYVYRNRAYTEAGAEGHDKRIKAALAEQHSVLDLPAKVIFAVDGPQGHQLVSDPVELYRLIRAHPDSHVRIIPVVA